MSLRSIAAAGLLGVLTTASPAASGTTITYQGSLSHNGEATSGVFDMVFLLFDDAAGGSQIGPLVEAESVPVADGQFTVELDFGADVWNGSRWLEIQVDGWTLTPRQALNRSPFAVQTRGIHVDENLNVGIGTTTPERLLDVASPESILRLTSTDDSPAALSRMQFRTVDAPGIFTPLGLIEFLSETDQQIASIQATKAGASDGSLSLRAGTDVTFPQMAINNDGDIDLGNVAQLGAAPAVDTFFNTDGGSFGVGTASPAFPMHVLTNQTTDGAVMENTGTGPALGLRGGADANLSYGGMVVVGEATGENMAIDEDEIMARNNGQPATLWLNSEGGDIAMGPHAIGPAYAYGHIQGSGVAFGSSNNILWSIYLGNGTFEIAFSDALTCNDIIIVSNAMNVPGFFAGRVDSGKLIVRCWSIDGNPVPFNFSFLVYRPQVTVNCPG